MIDKKSFIIYNDRKASVYALTNEEAGMLFKAIFAHHTNDAEAFASYTQERIVAQTFNFFESAFEADNAKWERRREAGKNAAAIRWGNNANECEGMRPNATASKGMRPNAIDAVTATATATATATNIDISAIAPKTSKKALPLEERKKAFHDELAMHVDKYGKDMITAFYLYWSEPNQSGVKMRWEMQKTWRLSNRLAMWSRNEQSKRS